MPTVPIRFLFYPLTKVALDLLITLSSFTPPLKKCIKVALIAFFPLASARSRNLLPNGTEGRRFPHRVMKKICTCSSLERDAEKDFRWEYKDRGILMTRCKYCQLKLGSPPTPAATPHKTCCPHPPSIHTRCDHRAAQQYPYRWQGPVPSHSSSRPEHLAYDKMSQK